MSIEVSYWMAVLCGLVGALTGSRSAWALLASAAICWILDVSGAHFELGVWIAIDVAVMLAIVLIGTRATDWIVMALFLPIFALYAADEYTRFYGVTFLVMMQFVLTLPWLFLGRRAFMAIPRSNAVEDIFTLRVCRGRVWLGRKA